MAVYTDEINSAFEDIKEAGRLVTITQTTPAAYDPVTGSATTGTTATISLYGVTLPYNQKSIDSFEIRYRDTTVLANKEIRFLMLAAKDATFIPRQTDVVAMDGANYSIVGVSRLSVNGEDILYKMAVFR